MKRVLITGAKGRIGQILTKGLSGNYMLTSADLPEVDARDYGGLLKSFSGQDVVIHLAWKINTENFQHETTDVENHAMFENAYRAALDAQVPRIVMASSVHADDFTGQHGELLTPQRLPSPTSPYGAHKVFMESMGRYYSKKGLEVVCVRFAATGYGVDLNVLGVDGKALWFSDGACVGLIKKILEAKEIPNNFLIMYGISNNQTRVHDYQNPLGWIPQDDSGEI